MKNLFSLGKLYVSDFLSESDVLRAEPTELKLLLDKNGAVRLERVVKKELMYGRYWYRSGTNDTMRKNLKDVVDSILSVKKLKNDDVWLDIACNDGTLLSFVPDFLTKVGIDPADDSYKNESSKVAEIFQDFFSADAYRSTKAGNKNCSVITTIAMFYDLDDPVPFLNDIYDVLDDDGLWVLQLSYTPLMIEQMAFDNICHEHIYYYSLFNLKKLFEENRLQIVDAQLNDVNGGSIRLYVMKDKANLKKFASQPHRDVCNFRLNSILSYENKLALDDEKTWLNFFNEIESLKTKTVNFIKSEKRNGKKIWAYGASTKGNTLLQYFGLNDELIDGIAERNPHKFGLKTIGTNIKIFSEQEMRNEKPDYLLVLPWHFISEFIDREKEFLLNGGKFIVPCPKFEIIGVENI